MKKSKKIIIIMTDTQRSDMLNCYKNTGLKTPSLDSLAASGMRFTRGYTTQPVCGPARSAIFTGLYPHSNGVSTNGVSLYDNVKTIGQRMILSGFHTAYIGKWHLDGGDYFGLGRCPDGWDADYWYDMKNYLDELSADDRYRSRQESTMDQKPVDAEFTFANRCSKRAIDFIEKHQTEDYLLVVAYDEPHHPSLCPEPYASMYKDYIFPAAANIHDTLEDKPDYQKHWAGPQIHEDRSDYEIRARFLFGCNSFVDSEIGRVLSAIDEYADDALVIYTSDHGDFLGSHRLTGKGPAVYDEITKIPYIIRQKDLIKPGTLCDQPVSHINIVPTIMEYAGLPRPQWLEGQSILPLLSNPLLKVNEHIFMEFGRYEVDHDGFGSFQPLRAVFDGRYKLSINLLSGDELYDLQNDPEELHNLIYHEEYAAIRKQLHHVLLDWQNVTRDPMRGHYWEARPWNKNVQYNPWDYTMMTRQREHEEFEPRQLDYATGLPIHSATRKK